MLIVDIAIFLSGSLFLYFNVKYSYIWFLTAELIVIRLIILIYTLVDFMVNKKIDQDFYYQTKCRIDVKPRIKNFMNSYKEKYNIKIKECEKNYNNTNEDSNYIYNKNKYNINVSSYTNSSNMNKNTGNTIKRSNSEVHLFSDILEKNKNFKKFYELKKEDIDFLIPRDDFYLIISSENPQKYYNNILREEFLNNSKIKIFSKAYTNVQELEHIEKRSSFYLENYNNLSLNSKKNIGALSISNSTKPSNEELAKVNTCPNFNSKDERNLITTEKKEGKFIRNDTCSKFVNFEVNNYNNNKNAIEKKDQKYFHTEQINNRNGLFSFKGGNEKPDAYFNFNHANFNDENKNFQVYSNVKFSAPDDSLKNRLIFNKRKSELVKDSHNAYDVVSFMNLSDRSSNRLNEK